MKKMQLFFIALMLPMLAAAQTIKSPDGKLSLTFSLTGNGVPTYSMTYKNKVVIKPSHLGLELAKTSMPQKALMKLTSWTASVADTKVHRSTRHGNQFGARLANSQQLQLKMAVTLIRHQATATLLFVSMFMIMVWDFAMNSHNRKTLNYFIIKEEHTQFAMTGDHKAWWLPGDYDTQEYETVASKLSQIRGLP